MGGCADATCRYAHTLLCLRCVREKRRGRTAFRASISLFYSRRFLLHAFLPAPTLPYLSAWTAGALLVRTHALVLLHGRFAQQFVDSSFQEGCAGYRTRQLPAPLSPAAPFACVALGAPGSFRGVLHHAHAIRCRAFSSPCQAPIPGADGCCGPSSWYPIQIGRRCCSSLPGPCNMALAPFSFASCYFLFVPFGRALPIWFDGQSDLLDTCDILLPGDDGWLYAFLYWYCLDGPL